MSRSNYGRVFISEIVHNIHKSHNDVFYFKYNEQFVIINLMSKLFNSSLKIVFDKSISSNKHHDQIKNLKYIYINNEKYQNANIIYYLDEDLVREQNAKQSQITYDSHTPKNIHKSLTQEFIIDTQSSKEYATWDKFDLNKTPNINSSDSNIIRAK